MATGQLIEMKGEGRDAFAGVLRFYELAKRQEWQVRDLRWGELPPIPEGKGSPERQARRNDMWRSVLTQQLQADMLACDMASQLLNIAPDHEAKLYYSTMVQDESRHTEAWLKLVAEAGGTSERDPHLDKLAHMTLEADSLEEKVFMMQVFYERLIISRFRLIARSSRGTVLEDLCNRLTTDDGIHHGAGMAYERVLLQEASKQTAAAEVGIRPIDHRLPADTAQDEVLALVRRLNADGEVDAILPQLPLPDGLDEALVILAVDAVKDVDGFHPFNAGQLYLGRPTLVPATPLGIMALLAEQQVPLDGARAVVVGRSDIVGKPVAHLLLQANASVSICHSHTDDLERHTLDADVLVVAAGVPEVVTADMVKGGSAVVDVGISRVEGGLVGDVDPGAAA